MKYGRGLAVKWPGIALSVTPTAAEKRRCLNLLSEAFAK